jgi:hypothetical protein
MYKFVKLARSDEMVIFSYWVSLIMVNLTLFKPLVLVHLKTPILDQRGKDGP